MRRFKLGFTLVELLVVIAIIGVLVSLLLPAVQAAREAARRMQCSNNMKQIGLALHNYLDTNKKFPAAGRGANQGNGTPVNGEIKGSNGLVSILPYVEQQNLYDRFNHAEAFTFFTSTAGPGTRAPNSRLIGNPTTNGNAKLSEIELSVYICPSDDSGNKKSAKALTGWHYGPAPGITASKTNYDFCTDSAYMFSDFGWKTRSRISDGHGSGVQTERMFGWESECRISDIKDGTSNTIAVSEITMEVGNGSGTAWAYRGWVMCGGDPASNDRADRGGINVWHQPWIHPQWQSPPYMPQVGRARSWWCPVGSLHPGGAQFTMGDGSVQFISQTISFDNLVRLTRMADGQPVSLQ